MAVSNVRMPDDVHERLKAWAQTENRSINDLVVEILDRETRRWLGRKALMDARRVREEIRSRHGEFPESARDIRRMREERARGV